VVLVMIVSLLVWLLADSPKQPPTSSPLQPSLPHLLFTGAALCHQCSLSRISVSTYTFTCFPLAFCSYIVLLLVFPLFVPLNISLATEDPQLDPNKREKFFVHCQRDIPSVLHRHHRYRQGLYFNQNTILSRHDTSRRDPSCKVFPPGFLIPVISDGHASLVGLPKDKIGLVPHQEILHGRLYLGDSQGTVFPGAHNENQVVRALGLVLRHSRVNLLQRLLNCESVEIHHVRWLALVVEFERQLGRLSGNGVRTEVRLLRLGRELLGIRVSPGVVRLL